MLVESFVAATSAANKAPLHLSAALKDIGIFLHEFQPQPRLVQGFKKSSVQPQCVAISLSHIFAAQADKAVINVYSRDKGNQEATVPFPARIQSLAFVEATSLLVIGTEEGKLIVWEVATGRLSTSSASHIHGVSLLSITSQGEHILSGSEDGTVFVWSLALLISFPSASGPYSHETTTNAPVGTFSGHRSPVTALACGHSRANTNFAVSASDDSTCYIWHIETCQVIRTVLLPAVPSCAILDPVDRAVYFGTMSGGMMSIDLLSLGLKQQAKKGPSGDVPIQGSQKDVWKATAQLGVTTSVTLSYDGTSILSGHAGGSIIQWDVAKRRMVTELLSTGQPVTNIQMLQPEGLHEKCSPAYTVGAIVKPKLELSNNSTTGGLPAGYNINVLLTGSKRYSLGQQPSDSLQAMTGNGWPEGMLLDAIRAVEAGSGGSSQDHDSNLAKAEILQDEVAALKQQIASLNRLEDRRSKKAAEKLETLEKLGSRRRQAYFDAKTQGKNGDAAMKPFEEEIVKIRAGEVFDDGENAMDTS